MKITNLAERHTTYTSNAYLLTGDYNKPDDINALIDAGQDPVIIENLLKIPSYCSGSRFQVHGSRLKR